MRDQGSSESAAIPRTCFRSGSRARCRRPPPHRRGADQLLEAAFDRERLEVRKPFLEREPLLVEDLAGSPKLECQLPGAPLPRGDDLEDLVEPPTVMRDKCSDTARGMRDGPSVRRKDLLLFECRKPLEAHQGRVRRR